MLDHLCPGPIHPIANAIQSGFVKICGQCAFGDFIPKVDAPIFVNFRE
ncbi:MAG: hypothetical protein HC767_09860 [Akkermansiaceae bacterium]|nr:hypothetical protein [Akkermansiaceae bacterium]